ncbi:ion channel [Lysobacter sp. A286]
MGNYGYLYRRWQLIAKRHPSAFLLAAQLLSLLLYPVFDGRHSQRVLFGAFGVLVPLLAVWVVWRSPAIKWVAWLVAVPAILISMASIVLGSSDLLVISSALESVLYFYTAGSLIIYMMNDHLVSADELFAAGATFTLLAWGFAFAYMVCQAVLPGSFSSSINPAQSRPWIELLFLSFTNLTATGLGDVTPVSSWARVLVMLEQFVGLGYIAVVVSRLIALTVRRHREDMVAAAKEFPEDQTEFPD